MNNATSIYRDRTEGQSFRRNSRQWSAGRNRNALLEKETTVAGAETGLHHAAAGHPMEEPGDVRGRGGRLSDPVLYYPGGIREEPRARCR